MTEDKLPDRGEYPPPDPRDLAAAIRAALDDNAHHRRGRYTAHLTVTQHNPRMDPCNEHIAVRVEECERDVIMDVPQDHAESVLAVLDLYGDALEAFEELGMENREKASEFDEQVSAPPVFTTTDSVKQMAHARGAASAYEDAANHMEDLVTSDGSDGGDDADE